MLIDFKDMYVKKVDVIRTDRGQFEVARLVTPGGDDLDINNYDFKLNFTPGEKVSFRAPIRFQRSGYGYKLVFDDQPIMAGSK